MLQGLPRLGVPAADLVKSSKGQSLNTMLTHPDAKSWADDTPRRMAVERAVLSVREKSSAALVSHSQHDNVRNRSDMISNVVVCSQRDCFAAEEPPPKLNDAGRPTTRTAMLAMRNEKLRAQNEEIGSNRKAILPVGVKPGAPGKNPEYKRFTHHDVDRMDPKNCR